MYDPIETDLSFKELTAIFKECDKKIPICLIGGWASYFYVNDTYKRAFGQDYMSSRDIDIFFDPKKEKEFAQIITKRGFDKNGLPFRYEKIYDIETKAYITPKKAKQKHIFNLIHIFLDLFSNAETKQISSWWDLPYLKNISYFTVGEFIIADINTLIALKCNALFARDKSDKENKDACDLYAILQYSNKKVNSTELLEKAIQKLLNRSDLLYAIAEHVLLDPSKQGIVEVALNDKLKEIQKGSKILAVSKGKI